MPNIVADQQGDDTSRQRANNIPVNAAKIDGIVQFSANSFKSQPFAFQSVLGFVPFGNGTLQIVLNAFGNVIRVNQPVADEQRIAFHGFRVLENDGFQFAMLDVNHAREILGERGGLLPVCGQMQFQPFLTVSDGAGDAGCRLELGASQQRKLRRKAVLRPDAPFMYQSVNPVHFRFRQVAAKDRQIIFVQIHNVIRPS